MTYHRTGAILTIRAQQVDVIGTDESLSQVNDRACQALFAMVIRCLLGNVTDELSDLEAR